MEELEQLRIFIEGGNMHAALELLDELDDMNRDALIRNIKSHMVRLLQHLIKQDVEGKSTRSWDTTIANALDDIYDLNHRRKSGNQIVPNDELADVLAEAWRRALREASTEMQQETRDLAEQVNRDELLSQGLAMITSYDPS
jgi:Domain of unknown function DUF29